MTASQTGKKHNSGKGQDSGLKSLDVFHHPAINACHSSSLPTLPAKHSPGSSRAKAELLRAGINPVLLEEISLCSKEMLK